MRDWVRLSRSRPTPFAGLEALTPAAFRRRGVLLEPTELDSC